MFFNTKENYGLVAKILHWSVAFGFLGAYSCIYFLKWFMDKGPARNLVFNYHMCFGISVGTFAVIRVIWRLFNIQPDAIESNFFEKICAKSMHMVLYFVMFYMPVTGYLSAKGPTNFFNLFTIPKHQDLPILNLLAESQYQQWLTLVTEHVKDFHKFSGKYIIWILISLHIGAALYHHLILRDRVLKRMLKNIDT